MKTYTELREAFKNSKAHVDESTFDWKKNKSEIDWTGKEPTISNDGGTIHKARTTSRNAETGTKDKQSVGRPKGQYGTYKIDAATRDDPEYKKSLSQKVMAAKKDGFEARTDFKTSLTAAIKKRQSELWAKTK